MAEDLKRGSRGALVKALQEDLLLIGYNPGTPDGVYGRKTESAVESFQRAKVPEIPPEFFGIAETDFTIPRLSFLANEKKREQEQEASKQAVEEAAEKEREEIRRQGETGDFGDDIIAEAVFLEEAERTEALQYLRKSKSLNMIHLNPLLNKEILNEVSSQEASEDGLSDDAFSLFTTAVPQNVSGSAADDPRLSGPYWKKALNNLAQKTKVTKQFDDADLLTGFNNYIGKRTRSVGELLDFFEEQYQADLADGKNIVSRNGADFKKIKFKLSRVKDEISREIRKRNTSLPPLLDEFLEGKYQVTLITSPGGNLESKVLAMVVFYAERNTATNTLELKRLIIEPELQFESAFNSDFAVGILSRLDRAYAIAGENLQRAKSYYSCGVSIPGADIHLNYMNFSNLFGLGFEDANKELPEIDKNRKREGHVEEVSGFTKTVNATVSILEDLFSSTPEATGSAQQATGSAEPEIQPEEGATGLIDDSAFEDEDDEVAAPSAPGTAQQATGSAQQATGSAQQAPRRNSYVSVIGEVSKKEFIKIWEEGILDPLILKVCPQTLPRRVLECLLPSDCRDLVKYLGLWRTRDYIENLLRLEQYANIGVGDMLTKWDSVVQSKYNFKAVNFNGRGGLKSGTFAAEQVYKEGEALSVSFLIRSNAERAQSMDDRTAFVLSQEGIFSVKRVKGVWRITLHSASGETVEYKPDNASANIFDDRWHQFGFSYQASSGTFVLYVDGIVQPTSVVSGTPFKGPLATPEQTRTIVASSRADNSDKAFSGELDEICVFPRTFTSSNWVNLAKIESDVNLNTLGYSQDATAWWRMGDAVEDTLQFDGPGGKITDIKSGINLTKIQDFVDPKVVVARLFKQEDEDEFIDILENETNFIQICDAVYSFMLEALDTGFNAETLKNRLRRDFKIPKFNKPPHAQVEAFIEVVVVNNLLRILAAMIVNTLQKYLLDCQNWKEALKALTKSTAALDPNLQQFLQGNAPLANFLTGISDPEFWQQYILEQRPYLSQAAQQAGNFIRLQNTVASDNPLQAPQVTTVSLGLGFDQVSFQDEATIGSTLIGGEFAVTEDLAPGQRSLVEIIKQTSQELSPSDLLELFTGTADQLTLDQLAEIINRNFPDNSLTEEDMVSIFTNFGSALGVDQLIGQLRELAQQVNRDANLPEDFCLPGQTLGERLGNPKTDAEKESDKAAVREILDLADQLNEQGTGVCPPPIPLSDFESRAVKKTINDVYAHVMSAYDQDLILYKLGMLSTTTEYEDVPKVLWKGDKVERDMFNPDEGTFEKISIDIKKTQINPDFEKMVEQGFLPKKPDGEIDGTRFGGVVKINWNPFSLPWFEDEGFLTEQRPPKSLAPKVEGDKVTESDAELRDIGSSLGPYTDYERPNARIPRQRVELGGKAAESLSAGQLGFTLEDSPGADDARYDYNRDVNYTSRGYVNIRSESKTSLLLTTAIPGDMVRDSRSAIYHKNNYGRSLEGEKQLSFMKLGADPFTIDDVAIPFNLSSELQNEIKNRGYDDGSSECDPSSATSETSNADAATGEDYTPQERVFGQIARQNSDNLILSESDLQGEAFNQLYREVLTALMHKVGDSPLLKAVPGSKDSSGKELLGLSFLNLETDPRLLDMQSFGDQVADDFLRLISCPEGLERPPLPESLKASVSRMLARVYLIDVILRGIIPFSELFFSKRDPVIKALIMQRIDQEIVQLSNSPNAVKAKIVEQFNSLARSGAVDAPALDEELFRENWTEAMSVYLEEEFDFVSNKIKEIVHGKCLPEPEGSDDGINEEMYKAVIKYAKTTSQNLKFITQAFYLNGDKKENFSIVEEKDEIEKVVSSLSFFYEGQEILISKVEKTPDQIISALEIDFDDLECEYSAIYPSRGQTTSAADHYHLYEIDENGNGRTTDIVTDSLDPNAVADHTHAVYEYAVVPLLGENKEVEHIHSLVQRPTQEQISHEEISRRVAEYMEEEVIETSDFKIMFDFCFNLNDAASFVFVYCLFSADNQIMSRAFLGTKRAVIDMYDWLWKDGPAVDPCLAQKGPTGLGSDDLFPDIGDAFNNPEYMLMLLLAPLQTFKGWTRTADPHVFITQTIMDILRAPIIPNQDECTGVYSWPGTSLVDTVGLSNPPGSFYGAMAIEPLVATGVTLIPAIPPPHTPFFPPTPFAYIYYFLVSPLLFVLKDIPRLMKLLENDPDAQRLIASTGMNVGPITCDDVPTNTGTGAEQEEVCPPEDSGFQDTIIDSAAAVCDD